MSNPDISFLTTNDVQTIVVTTTAASGPGSLAQAIIDASANDETMIMFDESLFAIDGSPSRYAIITLDGNLIPSSLSKTVTIGNPDPTTKVYLDFGGTYYILSSNNFKLAFRNIIFARPYRENNTVIYCSGDTAEKYLSFTNCAITCADSGTSRTFIMGNSAGYAHTHVYAENCIFHMSPNGTTQQTTHCFVRAQEFAAINCTFYQPSSIGNIPFDPTTTQCVGCIANYIPASSVEAWEATGSIVSDENDNVLIPEAYDDATGDFVSFNGAMSMWTEVRPSSYTSTGKDFWGVTLDEERNYGAIQGVYKTPDSSGYIEQWDGSSGVQSLPDIAMNRSENYIAWDGYGFTTNRVIPEIYHSDFPYSRAAFTPSNVGVLFVNPDSPEKNKYVDYEGSKSSPDINKDLNVETAWSYSGDTARLQTKIKFEDSNNKVIVKYSDYWDVIGSSTKTRKINTSDNIDAVVYYGPKDDQIKYTTFMRPPFHSKSMVTTLDVSDSETFCAKVGDEEYGVSPNDTMYAKFIIADDVLNITNITPKESFPSYNWNTFEGVDETVDMTLINYSDTSGTTLDVDVLIEDGVVIYNRPGTDCYITRIFGNLGQVALYAMGTPMTVEQSRTVFG